MTDAQRIDLLEAGLEYGCDMPPVFLPGRPIWYIKKYPLHKQPRFNTLREAIDSAAECAGIAKNAEPSRVNRLRLLCDIRSDLPFEPRIHAEPRVYEHHEISVNPHGAVSVLTKHGLLGVKPHEMEWLERAGIKA